MKYDHAEDWVKKVHEAPKENIMKYKGICRCIRAVFHSDKMLIKNGNLHRQKPPQYEEIHNALNYTAVLGSSASFEHSKEHSRTLV